VNYSDQTAAGTVNVADAAPNGGNDTILITELLEKQSYWRSASGMKNQGLSVIVDSWWAQIFEY